MASAMPPERLVCEKVRDIAALDAVLGQRGVEMIGTHRANRTRPPTQSGRPLHRFKRQGTVEHSIS
jgi:hypothetical protein